MSIDGVEVLDRAAKEIEKWFDRHGGNGQARMRAHLAPVNVRTAGLFFTLGNNHHVISNNVYLVAGHSRNKVIHEMGHILDNLNGSSLLASIRGRGPSDDMAEFLGLDPNRCFIRFLCKTIYTDMIGESQAEVPVTD